MGRNILFLCVFCLLIFETTAVNICTNHSSTGKDVSLNLNGTDVSVCNCSVKLIRTDNIGSVKPKMSFEVVNFTGCKYKLVIPYNNTESFISCSNNNSVFFHINKTDEIKLYLESDVPSHDKTTMFEVKIISSVSANGGPLVLLECFPGEVDSTVTYSGSTTLTPSSTKASIPVSPKVSTSSPSAVSMTGTTPTPTPTTTTTTTTTLTPTLTPTSTQMSISSSSSVSMTGTTPISVTPTVTQISSKPATGNDINETNTEDMGIIGGAVGGGLLLIILIIIIIIIVCVVKKRRKKNHEKSDYNRPTVTGSQHDYTDIDLGDKGNNSSSRQSDNTDQKANSPVEIEIIENDLYVSSNDIMDPKSRDNNNTNQTTDANNGPVEMEIIENDLYVSSSEALNSTSHDNNGPLYAEVNKKPKSRKSDQTDKSKGIAVYTDSDLGAKSNNLSSRQSDNTEQNTNSPVENQKTDANNDLYVSSSEALNSHDNDGPLYSSVNKKPKPPISNHADNSNGITGEDHHDTLL